MASSSAKWRALQRRQKWSYDALRLSQRRLQALTCFEEKARSASPPFRNFLAAILDLLKLTSTHAQLSALKKVISSFKALVSQHEACKDNELQPDPPIAFPETEKNSVRADACVFSGASLCMFTNPDVESFTYSAYPGEHSKSCVNVNGDLSEHATASLAFQILVELLFLENSVPLHRGILSCLATLSLQWKTFIEKALAHCLQEYGIRGMKTRHFAIAAVATSVMNLPKPGILKNILEPFASTITDVLSHGVQCLLQDARRGVRPTPSAMEECQVALSCMYYVLAYYPHKLFTTCVRSAPTKVNLPKMQTLGTFNEALMTEQDINSKEILFSVYSAAVDVILDVLQTGDLSRDCCIAAGAGFSAAVQVDTDHLKLASILASSLFASHCNSLAILTEDTGLIYELKMETPIEISVNHIRGTTLFHEVGKFTEFGRLCVLRGLLTAIPRSILNLNFLCTVNGNLSTLTATKTKYDSKVSAWSVLYNGALPALLQLCESSVNSHFKFQAVTTLQICLQQIKTSISLGLTSSAYEVLESLGHLHGVHAIEYSLLPLSTEQRILQIVWNNWEDPLNQTVKQIQAAFELLVDIKCLLGNNLPRTSSSTSEAQLGEGQGSGSVMNDFLLGILKELLVAGGHRKGRYVPLASLSLRLGALNVLNISQDLLFESVNAMVDDDVCCSVGNFLKTFLERLREDCWNSEGGAMEGIATFRRLSLPPLIAGMISGNSKLRININIYALPIALQIDSDAIFPMLTFALDGFMLDDDENLASWDNLKGVSGLPVVLTTNQRVALMIGLLKTARTEGLIEGDLCSEEDYSQDDLESNFECTGMAIVSVQNSMLRMPLPLLEIAVTHSEDSLRIDAAEALCLNPKTASMPSFLELALLKVSIPLNMRCASTSFRVKWTSLFRKFLLRIRVSLERQLKTDASRAEAYPKDCSKLPLEDDISICNKPVSVQQMKIFIRWFCNKLLSSLYPSAPYERKNMSMELIASMLESWSLANVNLHALGTGNFLTDKATTLLLVSIVDSWDKLREGAFKILSSYPTPLPGYKSTIEVEGVIKWAISLVNSPRVRESDAGALVLRLFFQKYVMHLGWTFKLHPQPVVLPVQLSEDRKRAVDEGIAITKFVESLNDWLEWGIEEGENNLLKACRHSFVHGVLLAYRYTIEELDWNSTSLIGAASALRLALNRLLHLLTRVTSIALWVVSADAFDMSQGLNVAAKPLTVDLQGLLEDDEKLVSADASETSQGPKVASNLSNIDSQGLLEDDEKLTMSDWNETALEHAAEEDFGFLAPSEQAIMVGCWLAMKEVSLLLGTVTRKVPLPGCNATDVEVDESSSSMLDPYQLELIGGHFLQVLLSMKHNGAIDKTRPGFVALCNRLLCSSDERLNMMPEVWLSQLMDRTALKGQTVDDLLRRSAGIPAAFLALFLSEPEGAPKKLLHMAMRWLIDLVKTFLEGSRGDSIAGQTDDKNSNVTSLLLDKARDEGVVPVVHAFNVLRVTFNDTNLSSDCSGFCAEGLSVAILAFSSRYWEVRNAAILAFTSLLRRMLGFLNDQTHEAARRAVTGFEFFHRYPSLHSFLLNELQHAITQLEGENSSCAGVKFSSLSRNLHPSLAPVLTILSRLKPSIINTNKDDWLSPAAFSSHVSKCATQSNMKVRMLASRALAPLVVSDQLPFVLHELVKCLPMGEGASRIKSSEGGEVFFLTKSVSFNSIHGVLLQLHSLLRYNCATLPVNSNSREEIISLLLPFLNKVDKYTIFRCPFVGVAFLQVLESLLELSSISRSHAFPDPLCDLLVKCSASVIDGLFDSVVNPLMWDPTCILMKVKACKNYFESTLQSWRFDTAHVASAPIHASISQEWMTDEFFARLKNCLDSNMYEVRLMVLKVLESFFNSMEPKSFTHDSIKLLLLKLTWAARFIHPLVLQRLKEETHPRCLRYLLLNHFTYSMLELKLHRVSLDCQTLPNVSESSPSVVGLLSCSGQAQKELWSLFIKVYNNAKHGKVREIVLCCLGLCVRQRMKCTENISILKGSGCMFCKGSDGSGSLEEEFLQIWLELLQKHSQPSESVKLRRASAEAIVASGILEQVQWAGRCYSVKDFALSSLHQLEDRQCQPVKVCSIHQKIALKVLDVWYICMKLLEDEDVSLREKLAVAVLRIVSSVSDVRLENDFVPAQVERVIRLSFSYLSVHLSHSRAYIECLATWIWKGLSDMDLSRDDCNLVRRLFDKEADNHHEEGLFFMQLCFLHIQTCFDAHGSVSESSDSLALCSSAAVIAESWRQRFLGRLRSFLETLCSLKGKVQWLGGPTNHPDVFKSLYPLLLGVLVFSGPAAKISKDSLKISEDSSKRLFKENAAELSEVVSMLKGWVFNPLISNLLILLIRQSALEESLIMEFQENVLSESFDPFFLL